MITSVQAVTAAAQKIPAYCTSGHTAFSPQQWAHCAKLGWQEPTSGAANFATGGVGSAVAVVLVIAAVLWLLSKLGGSRRTVTS